MHGWGRERLEVEEASLKAPPPKRKKRKAIKIADHAKTYRTAVLCEQASRNVLHHDENKAMAFVAACAARPDFTQLERVLAAPWLPYVKARPRWGAKLISQIISNRGGQVALDLALANERGAQLFELKTVVRSAKVFRGRYVLFRAKVSAVIDRPGAHQLELAETTLRAENITRRWTRSQAYKQRRRGSSGAPVVTRDPKGRTRYKIVVESHNVSTETQRRLTVTSKRASKVKEGTEGLFLVRFEGLTSPVNPETGAVTGRAALAGFFALQEGLP